jgi:lysozyme
LTRQINAAGLALIQQFEALALTAYRDQAGNLSIGYGHTGADVTPGMTITPEIAASLLSDDLLIPEATVARNVTQPLNDNQFSTLVCFTFNVGSGNFLTSTLLKNLNAGWYSQVPAQLARWNKVSIDGVLTVSAGLSRRRTAEGVLWGTPCPSGADPEAA